MKYLILGETFPFGKGRYRGIYLVGSSLFSILRIIANIPIYMLIFEFQIYLEFGIWNFLLYRSLYRQSLPPRVNLRRRRHFFNYNQHPIVWEFT